ncbi:MAG: alpha-glucosidase [Promethearchaeia archaeon]
MIRVEKVNDQRLDLYFKDHLLFSHEKNHPILTVGMGHSKIKEKHGHFKIKDKVDEKLPLTTFNILSEKGDHSSIEFSNENTKIEMDCKIVNERLEITFNSSHKKFNRYWINLHATADEAIYGCGEQFSELNLREKKVPIWVSEQGIGRGDPKIITWLLNLVAKAGGHWYTSYHVQPSFVSSTNYYVHAESTVYAEFNFKKKSKHILYFWGNPKKLIINKFENSLDTVSGLAKLNGIQPKLPDWVYDGMWLAIQGKGGKKRVRERLQTALDAGIKVGAIWSQDWEGINVTKFGTQLFWDWKWNGGGREIRFPNFPDFVKEMNAKGFKYLGYINSFLHTEGDLYKIAKENDYCVKNQDGEDYMIYVTTFPAALVDLTNPEAYEWIKNVMKEHMIEEVGLSGWMSDYGEYMPMDSVLHSGISPEKYHNQYPVDWQKANYEAIKEAGKLGEIVYFTRSGYSHTSKYTTMEWGGDQLPTFSMDDGLASVIPAALSSGICGVGYHHTDIGGFTTFKPFFTRDKEVMMRWAEQSTFTMLMRTHEGNQPENNVQFDSDEEVLNHLARMSQIHVHLKPYLQSISQEYQDTGISPMRPLFLHYENDDKMHSIKYQYLFGRDLLVAPVIKEDKEEWEVYLPSNEWIHIWTKENFSKGWHKIKAPIGKPPVFYREGSKFTDLFEDLKNF